MRHEERRVSPNITNEFLKQIPRLREARHHLLVCATDSVGMLDSAFLRPGRFDYILPVGPPNDEARASIWARYVGEITDQPVEVSVLVEASPLSRRRTSSGPRGRPRSVPSSESTSRARARARRQTTSSPRSPRRGRR